MPPSDFLSTYLQYTQDTEATATFHRWSAIVGIGALLERNICIQHGAGYLYPNHYAMLLGTSGSRKSAAIKGFVSILRKAGYTTFAAEKTSKEKFLQDLASRHHSSDDGDSDSILEANIFGDSSSSLEEAVTPLLIAADEANDFFGYNNIEFLSILGNLWDWKGIYENRLKHGKSDSIPNPIISILSGNTPTNFSKAFPPEIIGQGFFSRLLLIYGEQTRGKITWPTPPSLESTSAIVTMLQQIKTVMHGCLEPTRDAKLLADAIYKAPESSSDERFASYHSRRLTHLLKLSLVVAAARMEKSITERTLLQANTYLAYIERLAPKALGQYGKDQDSDIAHRIMSVIASANSPVTMKDLWKQTSTDLQSVTVLGRIVNKLLFADKIQSVAGKGFLPMVSHVSEEISQAAAEFVDFEMFLTEEELKVSV